MKYFLNSADETSVITLDSGKIVEDESPVSPDFAKISDKAYSLINNRISSDIYILNKDQTYLVFVDGERFEVTVEDEKERIIRRLIKIEKTQSGRDEVKAPMPGLIIKFYVKAGDTVKKGDQLAVIEAMKMENEIRAMKDGIIKEVLKKEGSSVEKDSVLLVIE